MVTRNFKRLLDYILPCSGTSINSGKNCSDVLQFISVQGYPYSKREYWYMSSSSPNYPTYPASLSITGASNAYSRGIFVGSDGTPPAETDYCLKSPLSGIAITIANIAPDHNKYGDLFLVINVAVTNNNAEDITVREICYNQYIPGGIRTAHNKYEINGTIVAMLDRTVLDSPITIPPGETGIIIYRLASSIYGERTIQGVPIVSFANGTDEEICAMIDAARQGKFDLQKDCGWSIGDMRTIHIDAFTGGGSTDHAAQDLDIIITSFDDYNNCGCLFQFDSEEALAVLQRMSESNGVNYGESEMVSTTLPALEAALPSWLKSRLLPFDVLYKASSSATELSTVSNQKLALRSPVEVSNSNISPPDGTYMRYYTASDLRTKVQGINGASGINCWSRTPYNASYYRYLNGNSAAVSSTTAHGLMFFGCI